ncbi:hypothetical protein [Ekhidna sp.]|uniref:dioxygenase family protein n=1 Tax=Ekhidna sp. TaxID=2608089 RepID=UPI0035159A97
MPKYAFLLVLSLASCGIDREINSISSVDEGVLKTYQELPEQNRLQISNRDEPGEPLILCLTFVDKSSGNPLPDQRVHFYHTDTSGEYNPSVANDESTARLSGSAITNSKGQILVQTILPGDYGSSADNRHIHTTVFGARPEAYDIHFKQYTGVMGRNFIDGSDQHFLADLKRNSNGSLITFLSIEVKSPY